MHLLALLNFTNFVATAGYGAVFILCLLQSCCVPTSSELTMGFAGALAAQGKLSLALVIVVGVLGEVVGAYLAWAVGHYAGRAVVDRYGRYLLLTHRDLDRAEAWYDRHQRFGVFGSRLLPVIRNFVAVPAGIAEVPLVRFGLLTAAGSLIWDGAWTGIGYGVGAHWHTIAKGFSDLGYVLAVVAVGLIAFAAYHRYRSYKEATTGEIGGSPEPMAAEGTGDTTHEARDDRDVRDVLLRSELEADMSRRRISGSRIGGPRRPDRVRWLGGSSGRPPAGPSGDGGASAVDRRIATLVARPVAAPRRIDFANPRVVAWEATVGRGRVAAPEPPGQLLDEGDASVEANSRLTAMVGVLLLALLAVEGVSIVRVHQLLTVHVVIGMVLVPVVVLKIGSTMWRFARYYLGSPAYRRKGPPPAALRLLGPFVVVTTVAVVGSGIALLVASGSARNELLLIHKVTFILWFAAMVVHVLGHLLDVTRVAPRDFYGRTKGQVRGAGLRQWAIVSAVAIGIILGVALAPQVGPWLAHGSPVHQGVQVHTKALAP